MVRSVIQFGLFLLGVVLLVSGCASTPGAPVAAAPTGEPTAVQSAPTVEPTTDHSAPATNSTAAAPTAANQTGGIVKLEVVPEKSQARYRVREQLASLPLPSDAIGKTSAITGTIVGKTDGSISASESKFVVDLSTLQSDRSQRDNFLRRNVLETDQYPDATFVPTQATGLPSSFPSSGKASFKLTGDLTIRNVTKPVTWDVTCQGQATEGLCNATTSFNFEYFNLTQPHVSVVLSIVDNITLEVDMYLRRVGA
jgi:polyisoprenoid-binding protein YceI